VNTKDSTDHSNQTDQKRQNKLIKWYQFQETDKIIIVTQDNLYQKQSQELSSSYL